MDVSRFRQKLEALQGEEIEEGIVEKDIKLRYVFISNDSSIFFSLFLKMLG